MSSPITLSNFNNIDFSLILNAVMTQASQPLVALQSRQTDLASETSQYSLLATKLGSLETAAADLSTDAGVTTYAATVSDTSALTVTPTGDEVAGTYDVVVNNLALAQVTASNSTAPDANTTVVATGGSLTIKVDGQPDQVVDVSDAPTGEVTLQGLATLINLTADSFVSASVVQSAPGLFRLVLTSTDTGLENAFTVTNALTGGSGVTFTDTDIDGVSGDSAADNAQQSLDASITVNGLDIASSSNTLTSAIPGTTMSLLHADNTKTITVSISPDDDAVIANVKTFVSAYNDLITFISNQTQAALSGQTGTLAHEALVREARNALRTALNDPYGSGTYTRLAEVGIGFNRTGQLTLTTATLTSALSEDRASVATLFVGTGTVDGFTDGAFGTVQAALDVFTQTGGLISTAQLQLNAQGQRLSTQIFDLQARLAIQRTTLQAEYAAADQAMTTLKAQSGSLGSMGSNLALYG